MSTQINRLAAGGLIERGKPVGFSFDGKTYSGYVGDTLASALLANGIALMGRSFKYHRPRGVLCAGSEEPNALVELRTGPRREPNTRATMVEIFEGLEARSQNRYPSLKVDLASANQLFGRFFTAGFYYKTFMWPASFWESVYEKLIRRSAGLGRAAVDPDPDHYEHGHAYCDVLVVGGGPAGLAAALAAAETGARVLVAEEMPHLGGNLLLHSDVINGVLASDWVRQVVETLSAMADVTLMRRTTVTGYYDHNVLVAVERANDHVAVPPAHQPRQRLWTIRAGEVVLAAGAHERPMVFDDNDKPGIMLSSAVRRYVDHYAVAPGRRFAICTNNDDAYKTAMLLKKHGLRVPVIADVRLDPGPVAEAARAEGIRVETGMLPMKAHGHHRVAALSLQRPSGLFAEKVECDCVAVSGGYSPNVHLASQTGASPKWREDIQGFVPDAPIRRERSAGAGHGTFDLAGCLNEGHIAGLDAAKAAGFEASDSSAAPAADPESSTPIEAMWLAPGSGKAFVDFQNDVTAQDIHQARQEGYVSVEHIKRYTTLGMATDQGKTSNVNGMALLAMARGQAIRSVGTTRLRPPYSPVAIGAFAGHERGKTYQPVRRSAMHACHERLGATFVEAGQWLRPQYYPRPGEDIMAAIWRETDQVRKTVGMCDVSTLGKIDIFGSDAGEFLNRVYINGWKLLPVGKARYGLMLREDGYVFDDGTTSRLAEDHYFMTTTTANAARVLAHLEHASQVLWPDLEVHFCSATEQWCGVAVAGPNARKVLADAFDGAVDLSGEALPFMGVREFDWNNARARIFRISFSGELAYEVNVPWRFGESMWQSIYNAGVSHGLIPYGTEALGVLRIEKGHVAGNELDGRTTAADMGLGRMMSSKKHFIGLPLSQREGMVDPDRPALAGFRMVGAEGRLRGGAHLVEDPENASTETSLGWITSVGDSPAAGTWIGLGYVRGGLSRKGERLYAVYPLKDEAVEVEVCHPVFVDPDGERLHG
jgi:sarcosine oxidase subunit alpha